MDDQTRSVLAIVCRFSLVILCYCAVVKKMRCGYYCSLFRQRLQSTLGWVSGIVATLGLFYPMICGVIALVLLVAIFAADLDYAKKTPVIRTTTKSSQARDARSTASG